MQDTPALTTINEQIDWVLARKDMSPWLKETLAAARNRDPIEVLNDLEILGRSLLTLAAIVSYLVISGISLRG